MTAASEALRILTIEDEPGIRNGIVAYLEDSGHRVIEAGDGAQGLDLFRREQPDVVLCDLRLPELDGLDVVASIATESPETPVIVVSGVSAVSDAVQALKRGAWDFVTKPIQDMGVVEGAVRRAIERARLLAENRRYREGLERLNRELAHALQRFRADQEAGRKTQLQLLPDDDRRYGSYRFSRRLFPSMYLSGDFVDYFAIDARHVAFYMADVSGHGAASAFVTVMLRTLVQQYNEARRSQGDDTVLHPGRMLGRLDRDLRKQNLDHHLTMFYGVIDQYEHRMSCSSAAQFPYPLLRAGTEVRSLALRSQPVGLFANSKFEERDVDLPECSALLLASDGVLELLPEGPLERKHDLLREELAGEATLDRITERLDLGTRRTLPDDVALLLVSRERAAA